MSEESVNIDKNGDGKSVTYRKRWEDGKMHHSVTVEKVEGGYVVTKSKNGRESEDGEYIDKSEKKVTTENPFADKAKESTNLFDIFSDINID